MLDDSHDVVRTNVIYFLARLDAGKTQHLFDLIYQPLCFSLYHLAVFLHTLGLKYQAARQIKACRLNHGKRSSQLVRNARDEFHLLS